MVRVQSISPRPQFNNFSCYTVPLKSWIPTSSVNSFVSQMIRVFIWKLKSLGQQTENILTDKNLSIKSRIVCWSKEKSVWCSLFDTFRDTGSAKSLIAGRCWGWIYWSLGIVYTGPESWGGYLARLFPPANKTKNTASSNSEKLILCLFSSQKQHKNTACSNI